ncbi:MAG: autotransporter outer membrane beta-barrel domain-containing protein [Acidobacteriota bacterium]
MKLRLLLVMTVMLLGAKSTFAQKHEIAFTSGGLKIGERGFDLPQPGFLRFSTGFTYEFNYARRLFDARLAALYFEVPFAGTPRTKIKTTNALSPGSYSSIFFTPGLKVKLLPGRKYSPFATMGVGLAHFREGDTTVNNQTVADRNSKTDAVFAFGFGLDVKVRSILSIRGEVRDFYSELPPLNVRALSDRQHNALISAGIVLRF